jgi:hypothetical protein
MDRLASAGPAVLEKKNQCFFAAAFFGAGL